MGSPVSACTGGRYGSESLALHRWVRDLVGAPRSARVGGAIAQGLCFQPMSREWTLHEVHGLVKTVTH